MADDGRAIKTALAGRLSPLTAPHPADACLKARVPVRCEALETTAPGEVLADAVAQYLTRRAAEPEYGFRQHHRSTGGTVEE